MMPYMAQGAAQATEDAAALAAAVSELDSLSDALEVYQQQRLPRATYIARNTRILQQWWHLYDGPARDKRDKLMSLDNHQNPMFWGCAERKDWLFGHDARILLPKGSTINVPPLPPLPPAEANVYSSSKQSSRL
jgi:salicylate hydroxylase